MSTESATHPERDWAAFYTPLLEVYQDELATKDARSAALAEIVTGATGLVHRMALSKLPGGRNHHDYADACQEMLLCVVEMAGTYQSGRRIPFAKWLTARTSRLRFTLLSFTRDEGDKKDLNMLSRSIAAHGRLMKVCYEEPTMAQICDEILREAREARTDDLAQAYPELSAAQVADSVERWLSKQSIKAGVARLLSGSLKIHKPLSLDAPATREDGSPATRADRNLVCAGADAYIETDADEGDQDDLIALATLGLPAREATTTRAVLAAALTGEPARSMSEATTRAVLAGVAGRVSSPHAQYAQYAPGLESQFRDSRKRPGCGTIDPRVLAQIQQLAAL